MLRYQVNTLNFSLKLQGMGFEVRDTGFVVRGFGFESKRVRVFESWRA